jgi:iron complex outermembrane receptor protein
MNPRRQFPVASWVTCVLWLGLVAPGETQESKPPESTPTSQVDADASSVQEVGGRLVVSGGTVVVTANADQPPRDSSVASKIDTPLIETPRSISIFDRRTLDDMAAININQAHDYTVGVTPLDDRGPAFARGFPVDFYDLRRDGLRTYSWSVREPVGLDRIQYLHGPAAVLYGDGSPGALINMVLKKPLPVPRFEFSGSVGNLGFGRATADATGPIGNSRRVRYRVIAASEWFGNGIHNEERRTTFLPAVAFDVSPTATLTFDTEIYDQSGRDYRHVVPATANAQRGDFSALPWNLSVNSPDYGWNGGNVSPGLRLDMGLGKQTSLHVAGRYTLIDGDINLQAMAGLAPDGRTANRFQYHEISTWREYQSDAFATTNFRTGRIEHRFVAGVETGLSTADSEIGVGAAAPLDIFAPAYPAAPDPAPDPTQYDVFRLGLYSLDQIRIGGRVIVVPAMRWSHLAIENKLPTTGEARSTESVVSPSVGLVVLPRPWFSLYTNFTQGFEPPTPGQYLEDGSALAPAENGAVEGGIKADLLGERLSVTGAAYRIRRTNVPEADVMGFYRQIGEAASHGVEVEVVGSLARGWGVRGGYAWTDTAITRDTSGFAGRELPNAPRHKAELWTRYRFAESSLRPLMIAGGVVHVADRFTARDNVIVAPAYTRIDASGSWDLAGPRIAVGVTVQNATNVRYVTSGAGAIFFAGTPRRVSVQLTSAF